MRTTTITLLGSMIFGASFGFWGCAASPDGDAVASGGTPSTGATGGTSELGGSGGVGGASGGTDAGPGGSGGAGGIGLGQIIVEPGDTTIDIDGGKVSGKSVSFSAKTKHADGTTSPINNCAWSIGDDELGTFNNATFQPSGLLGGATTVTCTVGGSSGSAKLKVVLHEVVDSVGLDAATRAALVGAKDPDPSLVKLSYPYDKTVFPRGVAAPELMWTAPSASDVYAVRFVEEFAEVTAFFAAPSPGRFQLPLDKWNLLLQSNPGKQVEVSVSRLSGGKGGKPYAGPKQTWTLSTANLKGTVYYWRVLDKDNGDVVKMPFGKSASPWLQSGGKCTGCHAVSQDGSVIAAATDVYGYTGAFASATGAQLYTQSVQSGYRAVSPSGSVVAWVPALGSNNYLGEPVELADAKTGVKIAGTGLESFGLTSTPSFSADGKKLALALRKAPHDQTQHNIFKNSDLAVADFDPSTHKASNLKVLVSAQNEEALVFPSFTPDNERVVFQRGNQVRARSVTIAGWSWTSQPSFADLWIVNKDGTGAVALAAASSAGLEPADLKHNFHPILSPVVQGGYFWVVFTSTRTYGNRLTATGDFDWNHCVGTNFSDCRKKQIWVAAIDVNATPGADPSHPAFWLPGQGVEHENFDAYWALDACKPSGTSCDVGFECCDGACNDVGGTKVCGKKTGCAKIGDSCSSSADCCSGIQCIGGVCDLPKVK